MAIPPEKGRFPKGRFASGSALSSGLPLKGAWSVLTWGTGHSPAFSNRSEPYPGSLSWSATGQVGGRLRTAAPRVFRVCRAGAPMPGE